VTFFCGPTCPIVLALFVLIAGVTGFQLFLQLKAGELWNSECACETGSENIRRRKVRSPRALHKELQLGSVNV